MGDLAGALLDADFALRERDDNAKAFFRQGQVSVFLCVCVISKGYQQGTFFSRVTLDVRSTPATTLLVILCLGTYSAFTVYSNLSVLVFSVLVLGIDTTFSAFIVSSNLSVSHGAAYAGTHGTQRY